jgi:hypothetical protein
MPNQFDRRGGLVRLKRLLILAGTGAAILALGLTVAGGVTSYDGSGDGLGTWFVPLMNLSYALVIGGSIVSCAAFVFAVLALTQAADLAAHAQSSRWAKSATALAWIAVVVSLTATVVSINAFVPSHDQGIPALLALLLSPLLASLLGTAAFWSRRATRPLHMAVAGVLTCIACCATAVVVVGMFMMSGVPHEASTTLSLVIWGAALYISLGATIALFGGAVCTLTLAAWRAARRGLPLSNQGIEQNADR